MPLYLEYDKTDGSIKRIFSADTLPTNVAYLAYQEIPEGITIDTSLNIKEVVQQLIEHKQEKQEKQEAPKEGPVVIEI